MRHDLELMLRSLKSISGYGRRLDPPHEFFAGVFVGFMDAQQLLDCVNSAGRAVVNGWGGEWNTLTCNGDSCALELTLACDVDDPTRWHFEARTFDVPPETIACCAIDRYGAECKPRRPPQQGEIWM